MNRLMTIVIENAGAQRGFLISEQDGQLVIEAVAEAGGSEPQVMQAINLTENNLLSAGIVQYVARTQQAVVLEDAAHAGEFVYDPYIQHHQVKSLLCIPLVNLGKTSGILYLENNLATDVFAPERLEMLDLLSSQMATSINLARLHRNLEQRVEERTVDLQEANEQLHREIIGRMEAEQEHDESRSRLASILNAAMDAIITINEEQIVVMSNPATTQMFGYAAADIVGRPLSLLMPEGNRKAHADHVRAFGQTHVTNRRMSALGSLWGRRANGEEFPIEVAISQVKVSGQKYYTAIARDITERRKAEAMLRESEEKFRNIAEQSPNMIFISQNGRIVFVNQQVTEIMGYSRKEFLSPDIAMPSFVAAESIELVQSNFARLMRGEKIPTYEYTLLNKAKERVEAIIAIRLINYESDWAILGVVTDIAHLKRTEASLRESERLLRLVTNNFPAFLSIIIQGEQDLIVDFTSGKEFEKLNLDPASFVGKTLEEVFGDQAAIVRGNYKRAFMGEEVSFELFINDQNQLYNAIPLIGENGAIDRIMVVVENVTERKLFEAQSQQAAATAERERLGRELHDAVTQTLFSASVIAKALPDIWEKDPAIGRTYMEQLPRLLKGALAEMRTLLLELRPNALREQTLGQLLELLAEAARARSGAIVTLKVEGDRPLPEDVSIALHRIAQESLNNVAKHAESTHISIWLRLDQSGVKLHISDDGRGFDPETIPSGHLGVRIMRERAQKIGATFQIDSKSGDGTIVIVTWSDQA
jgi:PAS domain S-box-containing protein